MPEKYEWLNSSEAVLERLLSILPEILLEFRYQGVA
jgi:hypothetical protein